MVEIRSPPLTQSFRSLRLCSYMSRVFPGIALSPSALARPVGFVLLPDCPLGDLIQLFECRDFHVVIGWYMGRQALARLRGVCKGVYVSMPKMHVGVYILHGDDRNHRSPLGGRVCEVDSLWLNMVMHRTADSPPTSDNSTLIIWCPQCQQTWRRWWFAGVRYLYHGQLEGAVTFQSELNSASASDLSDSDM